MTNIGNKKCGKGALKRMNLVFESITLRGSEMGGFLRRNGITSVELSMWKDQMRKGLENESLPHSDSRREYKIKIRKLEAELAAAYATIEIQKKVQAIRGFEDAKQAETKEKK